MHDDLLERRLSAALHDEAATLSLNVTAAELERRLALRRRSFAGRRLTLLLAAAVGIGLFGIGGALSGRFDKSLPTRTQLVEATDTAVATPGPDASSPAAGILPSLDELIARDRSAIAFAAAFGPNGPLPESPGVRLATPSEAMSQLIGAGHFEITFACGWGGSVSVSLEVPAELGGQGASPAPIGGACDGAIHQATVAVDHPSRLVVAISKQAGWRVLVRYGADRGVPPAPSSPFLEIAGGQQDLVHVDDSVIDPSAPTWGTSNLQVEEVGALPARTTYDARVWCEANTAMRLIIGHEIAGEIVADSESQIGCDGVARDLHLGLPEPDGATVYVAAQRDARWSAVVSGLKAPIVLRGDVPDWQLAIRYGPDDAFEGHGVSVPAGGEGVTRIQVVLACTGTQPIEVVVHDGTPIGSREQRFDATCAPGGAITSHIFRVSPSGAQVTYFAPQGSWTAMEVLEPDTDK